MKLRRKEEALKQVRVQAQGSQTRLKYSTNELDNLRKTKIPECQAVQPTATQLGPYFRAGTLVWATQWMNVLNWQNVFFRGLFQ